MGQQISADREIQILFNVGSDNEFNVKLELLLQADFDPIHNREIKEIYKSQQDQFKKLFNLLISKLDSNNPQIIKNSLRLITSFLPVLYEPEFKDLRDQVLFGTDIKVQVEQKILPQDHNRLTIVKIDEDVEQLDAEKLSHPNYQLLLESLMKLLLKPGFTIAQQLGSFNLEHDPRLKGFLQELFEQKEKLNLTLLWRGFATLTKYPNDQKQFIENRITVLSCLIAALSQQLYDNKPAEQQLQYLNGIEKNQLEIFVSLWATILFYRHCYFWFQDNFLYQQQQPRNLAVLCSIVMQIILSDTQDSNQIRQIIINNTILPFSVPFLIENISQSYLHDSKILSMNPNINLGYQEFLGLLLYILQHNKHVEAYINQMTEEELRTLISSLIFFISQYLDVKQTFNTYLISVQLMEYLLRFEQVGKFMQKQANLAFPIIQLPLATGTYFDILISFYGFIILKSSSRISKTFVKSFKEQDKLKNKLRMFKKKLLLNSRADLISISMLRASFYVRDLNESASEIFSQCLHQYFIYEYLFQNPMNSIDFYCLVGASINIVKNGGMKALYYMLFRAENIIKYKMGEKLTRKFFKTIDDQIQATTNEHFVAEPGLELSPEQVIRYDQFLSQWTDYIDKYLKHPIIDVLKQILTIGLQIRTQCGPSLPTFDQFYVNAQQVSWKFIKDIDFVPESPIKFSWTIFAYSNLLQPLDCLPKFNQEMIQLFKF